MRDMSIMLFRIDGECGHAGIGEKILSRAAFLSGFYVQSFSLSEGETETGFIKIDKLHILSKQTENSDFTLVLDPSNLSEVIKNCNEGSIMIINSEKKIKTAAMKKKGIKSYHVNAKEIALNHFRKDLSVIPMLGALAKIYNKISLKNMKTATEKEYGKDSTALEDGYKSVRLG
jgi:Pyruvate/2-oxoacid:ferredoxin oxidoreductase gamma subunit